MLYTIFQYTVKQDRVKVVREAIDHQIASIKREFGDAVQLKIFSSLDDRSYLHLASIKDDETAERYTNSPLLVKFLTVLHENCETYSQLRKLKFVNSTDD